MADFISQLALTDNIVRYGHHRCARSPSHCTTSPEIIDISMVGMCRFLLLPITIEHSQCVVKNRISSAVLASSQEHKLVRQAKYVSVLKASHGLHCSIRIPRIWLLARSPPRPPFQQYLVQLVNFSLQSRQSMQSRFGIEGYSAQNCDETGRSGNCIPIRQGSCTNSRPDRQRLVKGEGTSW